MSGPEQPDADDLARALAALDAGVEVELDGMRLRSRRGPDAWRRAVALLKLGQRDEIASMLRGDDGIPRHVRLLLADLLTKPGKRGRRPLVVDGFMVDKREFARLLKLEKRLAEEQAAGRRGPGQGPQVTVAGEVGMSERTVRRRMRGK